MCLSCSSVRVHKGVNDVAALLMMMHDACMNPLVTIALLNHLILIMASFPVAIERLKISTSSARSGDVSSARSVYRALCEVSRAIAGSAESELVATSALNALEELFSNRNIIIGKAFQSVVQSVYVEVLATTPGYAVRNVINSLMSIIANKNLSVASKECAVLVIGSVMEKRSFDLGSLMTDVVAGMTKLLKGSEIALRIAALAALKNICDGGGSLLTDCHAEMLRTSGKLMSDRSADVRAGVGSLFSSVAANSAGCSSVPADTILSAALRGLEDEIPCVQEKFAFAIACVYNELMLAYVIEQEKSKVGQARGGASDTEKSSSTRDSGRRGSVMKLKDLSSVKDMLSSGLGKKSTEDYDFRSVVKSLIKQTVKASQSHHRAAFIVVLQFLVDMAFPTLDVADIEWLFSALFSSLSEPAIVSLSYEDIVYFRSRLAHLLRFISSKIVELNQLRLSTFICTYLLDSSSPRTEHEIQLAFSELGQLVAALGEASASSVGVFNEVTTIYLRHSSFGVRASAAHVLVGLATVVPALASGYFSSALAAAREQVSLLLKGDPGVAGAEVEGAGTGDIAAVDMAIDMVISSSSGQDSPASEIGLRAPRKGPKEIERLKTMFFFHGMLIEFYVLSSYVILRNECQAKFFFCRHF